MKMGFKFLVGSLVLASALIACGKKGSSAPASTANAYGACTLNAQGMCVGGTATGGYIGQGSWKGNIVVTQNATALAKYQQFLLDNQMCSGLQTMQYPRFAGGGGLPCNRAEGFFTVKVQTVSEFLPDDVNFAITARFRGLGTGRRLETRAPGYMNANQNGFQLVFNRDFIGGNLGGIPNYGYGYRPGVVPYGAPGYVNPAVAQVARPLQIVVNFIDATRSVAVATVSYQGVAIAQGQIRADGLGQGYGADPYARRTAVGPAPVAAPYLDDGYVK